MKKININDILKVFAVGGYSVLMSAAAGAAATASVILYSNIPSFVGYAAVGAFALATLGAAAAFAIVYFCGAWVVRKGHFAK